MPESLPSKFGGQVQAAIISEHKKPWKGVHLHSPTSRAINITVAPSLGLLVQCTEIGTDSIMTLEIVGGRHSEQVLFLLDFR